MKSSKLKLSFDWKVSWLPPSIVDLGCTNESGCWLGGGGMWGVAGVWDVGGCGGERMDGHGDFEFCWLRAEKLNHLKYFSR
jgi:hypothetical protein